MEVLTGFLRNRYGVPGLHCAPTQTLPGPSNCAVEAQAIITSVGERNWPNPVNYEIDLSYIDLIGAWAPRADFHNVYFWNSKLSRWNLESANLRNADFR